MEEENDVKQWKENDINTLVEQDVNVIVVVKKEVAREEEHVRREKVEKDVRKEKLEEEDNIVLINKLI